VLTVQGAATVHHEPGDDDVTSSPPAQQLVYLAAHPIFSDAFNVAPASGSAVGFVFTPGQLCEPGDQDGISLGEVHATWSAGPHGGDP
jgi:hypothetical protein